MVAVTSLDGINGWSIQTLLRGENDSKRSDEIQAKTIEDSLVFNALVFLHTQEKENSPSRAPVIVNTLLTEFFLPGTIGILKPVNIIIFHRGFISGRTPDATSGCLTCNIRQFSHGIIIFLSVKIVFFFHLLTKERFDPYFTHLVL